MCLSPSLIWGNNIARPWGIAAFVCGNKAAVTSVERTFPILLYFLYLFKTQVQQSKTWNSRWLQGFSISAYTLPQKSCHDRLRLIFYIKRNWKRRQTVRAGSEKKEQDGWLVQMIWPTPLEVQINIILRSCWSLPLSSQLTKKQKTSSEKNAYKAWKQRDKWKKHLMLQASFLIQLPRGTFAFSLEETEKHQIIFGVGGREQ